MIRGRLREAILFFILWGTSLPLSAQKSWLHFVSPFESYKLDVKAGSSGMLNEVPSIYLDKINGVNIPTGTPGMNFSIVTRKAITGHFEFGYQLNYIGLYGHVKQASNTYQVHTQALENCYVLCYNLWRTDYFRPLNNCFVYYKLGAITMKNDPRLRLPDGSLQSIPGIKEQKFFFSNGVAVGTGVGVGYNRQLTPHLSLIGTLELSRSSDSGGDIFKVSKIFYNSPNTVNKYIALAVGVSYVADLKAKNKKGKFYKAKSETEKHLRNARIERKKKRWSQKSKDFWKR